MGKWFRSALYKASEWLAGGTEGRKAYMPEASEERDAYMHASASASMVYTWDERLERHGLDSIINDGMLDDIVRTLGNAKEALGGIGNVDDSHADSVKDRYNNEIGILIGEYVAKHNLSEDVLHRLVREAYDSGTLIRDETKDARVAEFESGHLQPSWTPPQTISAAALQR